jgi:hypothetical protein
MKSKPFDGYPEKQSSLRPLKGEGCRRGYGADLMRTTSQRSCAYCEENLTEDYYRWLLVTTDHVVPTALCKKYDIKQRESMSNRVIACSGCNGFKNKYEPSEAVLTKLREGQKHSWEDPDFFALRTMVFEERRTQIKKRREEEIEVWKRRPWERQDHP